MGIGELKPFLGDNENYIDINTFSYMFLVVIDIHSLVLPVAAQ